MITKKYIIQTLGFTKVLLNYGDVYYVNAKETSEPINMCVGVTFEDGNAKVTLLSKMWCDFHYPNCWQQTHGLVNLKTKEDLHTVLEFAEKVNKQWEGAW